MSILQSFQAISPIFLLILLGLILRQKNLPGDHFWNLNDKFAYWVLFPALLYAKTSTIELSGDWLSSYAIVIYGSLIGAVIFSLVIAKILRFNPPTAGSVLQGCARHNSFIALGLAERFFGSEGLSQAILISALLIPFTNIITVTLLIILNQKHGEQQIIKAILKDLGRNPLLLGVFAGILVNLLNVAPIPILDETASLLGSAALPMMLVGVGANIRLDRMSTRGIPTLTAVVGKMLVFPLVGFALIVTLGLTGIPATLLLLYGAVPTAASSYALARQMNGDAPLMAAIITIQTGLSFFTIPLTQWVANYFLS